MIAFVRTALTSVFLMRSEFLLQANFQFWLDDKAHSSEDVGRSVILTCEYGLLFKKKWPSCVICQTELPKSKMIIYNYFRAYQRQSLNVECHLR